MVADVEDTFVLCCAFDDGIAVDVDATGCPPSVFPFSIMIALLLLDSGTTGSVDIFHEQCLNSYDCSTLEDKTMLMLLQVLSPRLFRLPAAQR